jgi:hypothetical protein
MWTTSLPKVVRNSGRRESFSERFYGVEVIEQVLMGPEVVLLRNLDELTNSAHLWYQSPKAIG